MCEFSLVVAMDRRKGIGLGGQLPWHISEDLKYFRAITVGKGLGNAVIMGRKTWESLPDNYRPLKNRINVVLTRRVDFVVPEGVLLADSLQAALELVKKSLSDESEVFVIGGGEVFQEALRSELCRKLYITYVDADFQCDVFFPEIPDQYILVSSQKVISAEGIQLAFNVYER